VPKGGEERPQTIDKHRAGFRSRECPKKVIV